jgi:WD40 repeat protein
MTVPPEVEVPDRRVFVEFRQALRRESHNLRDAPEITWQQLHGRLQWTTTPSVRELLAAERVERQDGGPWVWPRARPVESPSLERVIPTGGDFYVPGSCTFSSDGIAVATTGAAGKLQVWDVSTGAQLIEAGADRAPVDCSFSPDGDRIAASYTDRVVRLWDSASGRLLRIIHPALPPAISRAFERERRRKQIEGEYSTWNSRYFEWLPACTFSPDATHLAVGSEFGRVWLFDTETGDEIGAFDWHTAPLTGCIFGPDATVLATADSTGEVCLWAMGGRRRRRPKPVATWRAPGIAGLAFSPDGGLIATSDGNGEGRVRLWNAHSHQPVRAMTVGRGAGACAFGPAGDVLAVAAGSGVVVFDVATGVRRATLEGPNEYSDCAFSTDGTRLAAAGRNAVALWDLTRLDEEPPEFPAPDPTPGLPGRPRDDVDDDDLRDEDDEHNVEDGVLSPDGRVRATRSDSGLAVRDASTGEVLFTVSHPTKRRKSVSDSTWLNEMVDSPWIVSWFFSPDASILFTVGDWGGCIMMWDVHSGEAVRRLNCPSVWSHALSPDGALLATGDFAERGHGDIRLWDTATGEVRRLLEDAGSAGAFSPDGRLLATSRVGEISVWDPHTGIQVARMPIAGPKYGVSFDSTRPALRCSLADRAGSTSRSEFVFDIPNLSYGPLLVVAVEKGGHPVAACPACRHRFDPAGEMPIGQARAAPTEVSCPGCGVPLLVSRAAPPRPLRRRDGQDEES